MVRVYDDSSLTYVESVVSYSMHASVVFMYVRNIFMLSNAIFIIIVPIVISVVRILLVFSSLSHSLSSFLSFSIPVTSARATVLCRGFLEASKVTRNVCSDGSYLPEEYQDPGDGNGTIIPWHLGSTPYLQQERKSIVTSSY